MKIFKDTSVKLHKTEKVFFFTASLIPALIFFGFGLALWMKGDMVSSVSGVLIMMVGVAIPVPSYRALNGMGYYKSE